jgi:hypothetical protein
MVQQQLVDYIKDQFKVGVGEDVLRGALLEAGWSEADIDDSVKSARGAAGPPASVSPPTKMDVAGAPIVMSDLMPGTSKMEIIAAKPEVEKAGKTSELEARPSAKLPKFGAKTVVIILVVLLVAAAGAAIFFYTRAKSAEDKLTVILGASDATKSQIADLTKANGDLTSQVSSLTNAKQELEGNLSFFVVPAGLSATSEVSVAFSGILAGGVKSAYTLTATSGIMISVQNYKDEKVDAALKPLAGQTVQISGTHTLGSQNVTVTAVNGNPVQ